jgi:hypothetical protein
MWGEGDGVVGRATHHRLYGSGSNPGEGKRFSVLHARSDRPRGPHNLLHNRYRDCFPRVKRPGCGAKHWPTSSTEINHEYSFYYPLYAFMTYNRETFTFTSLIGNLYFQSVVLNGRFRWPHGIGRGSAAARLLGLRVRIPPRSWITVSCECCVLASRGFCDGPITGPEESYRVCYALTECERAVSILRRLLRH